MLSGDRDSANNDGLVATVCASCEIHTVLRGMQVHIVEETDYPFRDTICLTVNPASELSFPLQLRIPAWAAGATLRVNDASRTPPYCRWLICPHRANLDRR
jgi:DUF1680 family protein